MSLLQPWNIYRWLISFTQSNPRATYSKRHSSSLLSLPNELLVEVLAQLTYSSIFSARMTCKKLYNITKSRYLWVSVIERLQVERGIVPPEEDISSYSTKELENWTLRRSTAPVAWELQTPIYSHSRLIDLGIRDFDDYGDCVPYLLPGGRWFLLAHSSMRMLVYDLDSINPVPKCLFNPLDFEKGLVSEYVRYTFWFDYSSPCLSFHVAGNAFNTENSRTIIYSVELEGHGVSASLSSSVAAALRSYGRRGWRLGRFALNRHYYVEVRADSKDSKNQDILAYRFEQASRSSDYCSIRPTTETRFSGNKITLAAFVYDDVLAVCTLADALRLYRIVQHEPILGDASPSSFNLMFTVPLAFNFYSNIRWSPYESYLVSMTLDGVFRGVRIPHDGTVSPTVTEFGKHDTFLNKMTGWSLDTSISISINAQDAPVEFVCHPWIGVGDSSPSLKRRLNGPKVSHLGWRYRVVDFCEDVGRLVVFKDGRQTSIVVADFTVAHDLYK